MRKYTIEEAFDILKKALRPLGDDYVLMLDLIKQQRWIKWENKRGGAYSWGTYHSLSISAPTITNPTIH